MGVSAWTPHKDNRGVNGVHKYKSKSNTSEENLTRRVTDTLAPHCSHVRFDAFDGPRRNLDVDNSEIQINTP